MARGSQPLNIQFFATGLYTHRSPLFSPYRSIGINVVTYHDAALGGQDMEIGAQLEWSRRPGFSRFCPIAFGASEYPLQFYSAREPDGSVVSFVDTNKNFSTFSPYALTPLFTKSSGKQGYLQQVQGITYYTDGSALDCNKWIGYIPQSAVGISGTVAPWGLAAPTTAPILNTSFTTIGGGYWSPGATIGTDGIFIVDSNGNIQVSQNDGGVTGAQEPIWAIPTGTCLTPVAGTVTKDGTVMWNAVGPYSTAVWSPSVSATPGGGINAAMLIDSNGNLQLCTLAGTTGGGPPTWNVTLGGTTTDGSVTWKNYGPAALSVQAGYSYAYGWRTIYGHLTTLSPMLTIGAVMGPLSIPLIGASTVAAQCVQQLSLTSVQIVNNVATIYYSNLPAYVGPGQNYSFSGLTNATFLNGLSLQIVTAYSNTITVNITHANYGPVADTGLAKFDGVEVYRTADGGGILLFDSSFPNFGGVTPHNWSYTDTTTDGNLDFELIGPTAHLNDPPPGTTGSLVTDGGTILAYWQGRIWMAVGNQLYFDAGPDCINGVPEESWPPANVLQYSGPITGLSVTSQGMLVWGADFVSMALGGPQTLSFFPYDLLQDFGVSSSNCLAQDGDTITCLTTQGQCFTLNASGKSEIGNYIVDQFSTFYPKTSYVTSHRNGTDSGLWLANGANTAFRYSLNVGAWSTAYLPVGGIGALNSVETSVGVFTLCAGRTSGGGYILGRNLTTWQDDGQNYTNCFVTLGSIGLTPPGGPLVPLQHIVLYCNAVGTLGPTATTPTGGPTVPTVAILPNEISATPGPGFLTLSQPISEYTTANAPTKSLLSLRYNVDSMNVTGLISQLMHHVQIQISFPPENAKNTIKTLSLMFDKDQ